MLKKKNVSKKKSLLKTLCCDCIPFKVILFGITYVLLVLINIPLYKWSLFNGEQCNIFSLFLWPIVEIMAVFFVLGIITSIILFIRMLIAYRNYCYIPFSLEEVKENGFDNANAYFSYVMDMLSYGFKNIKFHVYLKNEDICKMVMVCLQLFPKQGTIFQIKTEVAENLNDLFGLCIRCAKSSTKPKVKVIDNHVVFSWINMTGKKEEYKI